LYDKKCNVMLSAFEARVPPRVTLIKKLFSFTLGFVVTRSSFWT